MTLLFCIVDPRSDIVGVECLTTNCSSFTVLVHDVMLKAAVFKGQLCKGYGLKIEVQVLPDV